MHKTSSPLAAAWAGKSPLEAEKHVKYLSKCLEVLPHHYASLDTNRLTVAYFCVSGLDVLGALDRIDAPRLIRWVYSLQVSAPAGADDVAPDRKAGFRGAPFLGAAFSATGAASNSVYDGGHLAMTYTALAILVVLGDDLAGVHRDATLAFVRSLQDARGHYHACRDGEADMRFLFCAAAIGTFLAYIA
jgi:geranylgeranyl transferase type-1 subunit beta